MRRVVVSGAGVVSPLGNSVREVLDAMARGQPGIRRLEGERLRGRVGAVADFDAAAHFPAPRLRMLDRVSQFALAAAAQALADAALEPTAIDRARSGVFVGTGMGGSQATDDGYRTLYGEGSDRLKPYTVLLSMANAPASWIALEHGLRGPSLTYSTACSSSAVAIGEAARRIERGEADVMIAGGAEAPLTLGTIKAWEALKALAPEDPSGPAASCKPFARDRAGLVLGEGAAMFVLEDAEHLRRRGGRARMEVAGYGLVTDTAHVTRPSVEGQQAALERALADAGMGPEEVGYVNAHGTGTAANDGVETAAIRGALGECADRVPVSSTKSMHGHLLGAAAALELFAVMLAIEEGVLAPTLNLRVPDPECDLDYVPLQARRARVDAALSSSFAFGGTNAVLALRAPRR